ncbi:MAG: DUF1232 domain-containing protein [Caldilinea sp. CFX5]|nr:DUF1232 domain-containing protein [Caldilinea sp. CFX5]
MSAPAEVSNWRAWARRVKRDVFALYLACRDPRTPWVARLVAAGVVAYAFSPIDLIPDFIPILGYLDDLILVPLGILLAIRLIPPVVMADCRAAAQARMQGNKPVNWGAAGVIIGIWVFLAGWALWLAARWFGWA